jgi:ribosomal protein S18 acetylase RimI-like enzyme
MAELVNIAGEGLPLYLWSKMTTPGQDPWEVGRARAQRENGGFSYRNTTLLVADRIVVGGIIGYPLPDEPEPIDYDNMPAMFIPLQRLENLACGTWYVNVLATLPDYRNRGYGSRLLALADQRALETGRNGASIIVSDGNSAARRLYERCGYRIVAEQPMVKERWQNPGQNWILLIKRASSPR